MDGSRALVTDEGLDAILSVDLATGNRTPVSSAPSIGQGPAFIQPRDIILDGGRALVSDSNRIIAVDLQTGDHTVISM